MFVEISVHGVLHTRCFPDVRMCRRGGRKAVHAMQAYFSDCRCWYWPQREQVHTKTQIHFLVKAHFMPIHSMSCVSSERSPFEIHGMFMKDLGFHTANVHKQARTVLASSFSLFFELEDGSGNKTVIFIFCLPSASRHHHSHPENS